MKILIYGAGPLGSLYAARLTEAGHDVALLARGQRLKDVQVHGVIIENSVTGEREQTTVKTVESLSPEDDYDLVMVVMRKNQALDILPTLAANERVPTILFLMNDMAGPGLKLKALGSSRLLRGFPLPGGMRAGSVIRIVPEMGNRPWEIPIGEVDGRITERTLEVAAVLESMPGFKVDIRTDMDAWLKYHAALVVPMASAFYAAGGEKEQFLRSRDAILLGLRAQKEAIKSLRMMGIKPTPGAIRFFEFIPEPIAISLVRSFYRIEALEASIVGHAIASPDEMQHVMEEMLEFFQGNGVKTPNLLSLYTFYDPNTSRLPDGEPELKPDWRSLIITGAVVVGIIAILKRIIKK
jgi:ketopantoate reductase